MIHDPEIRIHHRDLDDLSNIRDHVVAADIVSLAETLRFVLRSLDKLSQRLYTLESR